jgi:hypothetical protein
VLYELFAGSKPFAHRSTTPEEWTDEAWQARPPFKGPRDVATIVARCLAVEAGDRYRNGGELVTALDARRRRRWPWLALPLVAAIGAALAYVFTKPAPEPRARTYKVARTFDDGFTRLSADGDEMIQLPRDGSSQLAIQRIDTGVRRTITLPPGPPIYDAWLTRDELVIRRGGPNTRDETIWKGPIAGPIALARTIRDVWTGRVSPDGKQFAWATSEAVFVGDLGGESASRIYPLPTKSLPSKIAWSPRGDALAILVGDIDCWLDSWVDVVALDGTGIRRVAEGRLRAPDCTEGLTWSQEHELLVTRRETTDHVAAILSVDPAAAHPSARVAYEAGTDLIFGPLDASRDRVLTVRTEVASLLHRGSLADGRLVGALRTEPLASFFHVEVWSVLDGGDVVLAHLRGPHGAPSAEVVSRKPDGVEVPFARVDGLSEEGSPIVRDGAVVVWRKHEDTCSLVALTPTDTRELARNLPCNAVIVCGDAACVWAEGDARHNVTLSRIDLETGSRSAPFFSGDTFTLGGLAVTPDGRRFVTGTTRTLGSFVIVDIETHETHEIHVPDARGIVAQQFVTSDSFLALVTRDGVPQQQTRLERITMTGVSEDVLWSGTRDDFLDSVVVSPDRRSFAFSTRKIRRSTMLLEPE